MPVPAKARISILDFANQTSSVNPNTDGENTPTTTLGALQDIAEAAFNDGFILGRPTDITVSYKMASGVSGAIPADAAREIKWLVSMEDTSEFLDLAETVENPSFGKLFEVTFPTANLSLLTSGSEFLDLTDLAVAPTVALMEAWFVSPNNGELTVRSIRKVGRNL